MLTGRVQNKEPFSEKQNLGKESKNSSKKVSKEIGEYVDYEDVKKDRT